MMNFFERWLSKLAKILQLYRGPVLESSYHVSDGEAPLAILTKPDPDQFWVEFSLIPLTQDPAKLERLYSWDFWNSCTIVITEADSDRRVHFLPALHFEEANIESVIAKLLMKA